MKKFIFFLFISLSLQPIAVLSADTQTQNTIQIAPLKYEENLNLGDVKEGTIDVMNPTTKDEMIQVEATSLKMTGINGQLEFYNDQKSQGFEKFITFDSNQFLLPAGEGKKVKFRLGIPISASSGAYFGAVFFRLVPDSIDSSESKAIATGQAGTIFLLTVGQGDVRSGKLDSFNISGNPFSKKTVFEVEQSNLSKYNTTPRGTYLKPTGTITVKNIFGKVKSKQEISSYYVLPETKRIIKKELESPYLFGLYKAELSISNYPGDPVITKSSYFVKLAPAILGLITFFALVIFTVISFVKPKLRKK